MRVIRNWLVRGSLVAASVAAMTAASLTPTLSRASAQDGGDPPPTPTAQTRFVYASSSSGDDANEGLSPMEPKQSLAAAAGLLRSDSSDWLLLKRGDEWNEGLAGLVPNGASEQTPIVITAYGDGADPRVMPGDAADARPDGEANEWYGIAFADVPAEPDDFALPQWSNFVPSDDSRVIYVSSSLGSDDNDGLSPEQPKETLRSGAGMLRDGYPDHLLLRRGDTWQENFGNTIQKSGRSADEPIVVGTYGTGARPKIQHGGPIGIVSPVSHLAITGLHLEPLNRQSGDDPTGVLFNGPSSNILLEDLYIAGFSDNIVMRGWSESSRMSDVIVRGCVIVDSYSFSGEGHSQGIYGENIDDLVIEFCVFDHNGHNPDLGVEQTIFNHNVYVQTGSGPIVFRHNISARASSHGLQGRPGGLVHDNLFGFNPIGFFVAQNSSEATHNVVIGGADIGDEVRGFGFQILLQETAFVANNLVAHRQLGSPWGRGIDLAGGEADVTDYEYIVENNVVYNWDGTGMRLRDPGPHINVFGSISGNRIIDPDGTSTVIANQLSDNRLETVRFSDNTYLTMRRHDEWFAHNTDRMSIDDWQSFEPTALTDSGSMPDPSRRIGTYYAWIGGDGTHEGFLAAARRQSRANWRPELSAPVANEWIRNGFGLTIER